MLYPNEKLLIKTWKALISLVRNPQRIAVDQRTVTNIVRTNKKEESEKTQRFNEVWQLPTFSEGISYLLTITRYK